VVDLTILDLLLARYFVTVFTLLSNNTSMTGKRCDMCAGHIISITPFLASSFKVHRTARCSVVAASDRRFVCTWWTLALRYDRWEGSSNQLRGEGISGEIKWAEGGMEKVIIFSEFHARMKRSPRA
jgi:hypothetical protein